MVKQRIATEMCSCMIFNELVFGSFGNGPVNTEDTLCQLFIELI